MEKYPHTLDLGWLDWIFNRGYLPSLRINYVSMSKDMGKTSLVVHVHMKPENNASE